MYYVNICTVCMYVCMYVCMHTCMYYENIDLEQMCTLLFMFICMYVCIYMNVCYVMYVLCKN